MEERQKREKNLPSSELAYVIELVNSLPWDFLPSDANDLLETIFFEETGQKEKSDLIERNARRPVGIHMEPDDFAGFPSIQPYDKVMLRTVASLRKELNKYFSFVRPHDPRTWCDDIVAWLVLIDHLNIKDAFLSIVKEIEASRDNIFGYRTPGYLLPTIRTIWAVDKKGLITFQNDLLKQVLQGVEAFRLKRCRICVSIFWAYRLDKRCCSTKCGNALKMRKLRLKRKKEREKLYNYSKSPRYHEKFSR